MSTKIKLSLSLLGLGACLAMISSINCFPYLTNLRGNLAVVFGLTVAISAFAFAVFAGIQFATLQNQKGAMYIIATLVGTMVVLKIVSGFAPNFCAATQTRVHSVK